MSLGNLSKKVFKHNEALQLAIMMTITIITQFLAIFKTSVTASIFGAGVEMDAYNFANNLATFFLTFVSAGVTTVIIPAYVKKKSNNSINTFVTTVFTVVGILLAIVFLFRSQLVDLLTVREEIFKTIVSDCMLIVIFIQLFPAFLGVTTAYFQCKGYYNIPKVVLCFVNAYVVLLLLLNKNLDMSSYLKILFTGAFLNFIIDVGIAVKCGFRYKPCLKFKDSEFRTMLVIFLPTILSSGIYKVNTLIDSLLASNLDTGSLTMLSYSSQIVAMVNLLVIGNLTVYAYPKLVRYMSEGKERGQLALGNYIMLFHAVLCLIITGFIAIGREFIGLLYEHGKFTSDAANVVYICMCIYIFGQQTNIIRDLLYRYCYANGDTKRTTTISFISSVVNIVVSIILCYFIGLYGIVIGTVVAGMYSLTAIFLSIRKRYGYFLKLSIYLRELIKTEIVMIFASVSVLIVKNMMHVENTILSFGIYGFMAVVLFVGGLFIIRSKAIKARLNV